MNTIVSRKALRNPAAVVGAGMDTVTLSQLIEPVSGETVTDAPWKSKDVRVREWGCGSGLREATATGIGFFI